jgi:hypothetical protein
MLSIEGHSNINNNDLRSEHDSKNEPPKMPMDDMMSPASVPGQCMVDLQKHYTKQQQQHQQQPSPNQTPSSGSDEATNEESNAAETMQPQQQQQQQQQSQILCPRTGSQRKKPLSLSRSVRFADMDEEHSGNTLSSSHSKNGGAVEFDSDKNELYLTPDEMALVWWSNEEVRENYQSAKDFAADFRRDNVESLNQFNELFLLCSDKSSVDFKDLPSTKVARAVLAQRDTRGLERSIHPIISTHRAKYTKTFLILQSKVPRELSQAAKERVLCARSMQITRPSRALARLLGHGDGLDVSQLLTQDCLAEEEEQQQEQRSSSTSSSS